VTAAGRGAGALRNGARAVVCLLTYFGLLRIPARALFATTTVLIACWPPDGAQAAVSGKGQLADRDGPLSGQRLILSDSSFAGRALHTLIATPISYRDAACGLSCDPARDVRADALYGRRQSDAAPARLRAVRFGAPLISISFVFPISLCSNCSRSPFDCNLRCGNFKTGIFSGIWSGASMSEGISEQTFQNKMLKNRKLRNRSICPAVRWHRNSSAKVFKTNVWRLFQYSICAIPQQIAYYDDGVGHVVVQGVCHSRRVSASV